MTREGDRAPPTDILAIHDAKDCVVPLRKSPTKRQMQRGLDAARLHQVLDALGLPPTYFHDQSADRPTDCPNELWEFQARDMAEAFGRITNPFLRERVLRLVQTLASD